MSVWCKAEVVTTEDGKGDLRQTVEGNGEAVAAWLRAVANELDPPRPALRASGGPVHGPLPMLLERDDFPLIVPKGQADRG
jgi:hypothetical protein